MKITAEIDGHKVVSTGEISRRFGFVVSAAFLKSLGLEPLAELYNGTFWLESDLPSIRTEVCQHLEGLEL